MCQVLTGFYNSRLAPFNGGSDKCVSVLNCFFLQCIISGDYGGAFYLNDNLMRISINDCTFSECSSKGGGAYTIFSKNALIKRVCGYKCSSSEYNPYCVTSIQNGNTASVEFLSVSLCFANSLGTTNYFLKGNVQGYHINSSDNHVATWGSGFQTYSCESAALSFSTFSRNYGTSCILFDTGTPECFIHYSNIIRNQQIDGSTNGLFFLNSKSTVSHTSIVANTITKFLGGSATLALNNCILSMSSVSGVSCTNCLFNNSQFTNIQNHLNTHLCPAILPMSGAIHIKSNLCAILLFIGYL